MVSPLFFQFLKLIFGAAFLAWLPIAFPFGKPFIEYYRENGSQKEALADRIWSNWAYYFVYNVIGWSVIWIKIVLWNCKIWRQEFFLPWMLTKRICKVTGNSVHSLNGIEVLGSGSPIKKSVNAEEFRWKHKQVSLEDLEREADNFVEERMSRNLGSGISGNENFHSFVANGSFKAFIVTTMFTVAIYLIAGILLEGQPVPLGTISLGVVCYGVQFLCVYIWIFPKEKDFKSFIKVFITFFLFIAGLCTFVVLTWLGYHGIPDLLAKHFDENSDSFANWSDGSVIFLGLVFFSVTNFLSGLRTLDDESKTMALLWRVGYGCMYSTYMRWLLPESSSSFALPMLIIVMESFIDFVRFKSIVEKNFEVDIEDQNEINRGGRVNSFATPMQGKSYNGEEREKSTGGRDTPQHAGECHAVDRYAEAEGKTTPVCDLNLHAEQVEAANITQTPLYISYSGEKELPVPQEHSTENVVDNGEIAVYLYSPLGNKDQFFSLEERNDISQHDSTTADERELPDHYSPKNKMGLVRKSSKLDTQFFSFHEGMHGSPLPTIDSSPEEPDLDTRSTDFSTDMTCGRDTEFRRTNVRKLTSLSTSRKSADLMSRKSGGSEKLRPLSPLGIIDTGKASLVGKTSSAIPQSMEEGPCVIEPCAFRSLDGVVLGVEGEHCSVVCQNESTGYSSSKGIERFSKDIPLQRPCGTLRRISLSSSIKAAELQEKEAWIELAKVALGITSENCANGAFLLLYTYNCYGPNDDKMYILDQLSAEEKRVGLIWCWIVSLISVLRACFYCSEAQKFFSSKTILKTRRFVEQMLSEWFWLLLTLLAATEMGCGACLIMKHDGMDLSFKFEEWKF